MKKTIWTVIVIIGVLVLGLLLWNFVFKDGGALETGWNAFIGPINETWSKISGSTDPLIPDMDVGNDGGGLGGLLGGGGATP